MTDEQPDTTEEVRERYQPAGWYCPCHGLRHGRSCDRSEQLYRREET